MRIKLVSQQILCCHNDVLVNKREAEEWMAVCVCVCVRRDLFFIQIFFFYMQDGHTRPERLELHVLKAVYIFRPRRIVQCTMCGVIILNGSLCDLTTLRGFENVQNCVDELVRFARSCVNLLV